MERQLEKAANTSLFFCIVETCKCIIIEVASVSQYLDADLNLVTKIVWSHIHSAVLFLIKQASTFLPFQCYCQLENQCNLQEELFFVRVHSLLFHPKNIFGKRWLYIRTRHKKWSFPFRISSVNVIKSADLVTFTKAILNGKLHFLCSGSSVIQAPHLKLFNIFLSFITKASTQFSLGTSKKTPSTISVDGEVVFLQMNRSF